jgi:hypothetical protein
MNKMIIKLLGILDIIIALSFWLFGIFSIIPKSFILLLGFVLLIKGALFSIKINVTSILDVICALVIISAPSVKMPLIIVIIISLFLLQKGVFSLFS